MSENDENILLKARGFTDRSEAQRAEQLLAEYFPHVAIELINDLAQGITLGKIRAASKLLAEKYGWSHNLITHVYWVFRSGSEIFFEKGSLRDEAVKIIFKEKQTYDGLRRDISQLGKDINPPVLYKVKSLGPDSFEVIKVVVKHLLDEANKE